MNSSKKEIYLHYKGIILYDTIGDLISELKEIMFERHVKQSVYKKVLMVMIEALENVLKYHENFEHETGLLQNFPPEITISRLSDSISITVGNPVLKADALKLKMRLEETALLDKQGVKDKYKQIITNGQFSEKGGAGLGIVEMAKITDRKINFTFHEISETYDYYRITLRINCN